MYFVCELREGDLNPILRTPSPDRTHPLAHSSVTALELTDRPRPEDRADVRRQSQSRACGRPRRARPESETAHPAPSEHAAGVTIRTTLYTYFYAPHCARGTQEPSPPTMHKGRAPPPAKV